MKAPEPEEFSPHNKRIQGGKYRGKLFTRVPMSYLRHMVRNHAEGWQYAKTELERRGDSRPKMECSLHSIDKASLTCLKFWKASREKGEGIATWLSRKAREALNAQVVDASGRFKYEGMKFVITFDNGHPFLKTVYPR